jgi:hypothetical protein
MLDAYNPHRNASPLMQQSAWLFEVSKVIVNPGLRAPAIASHAALPRIEKWGKSACPS